MVARRSKISRKVDDPSGRSIFGLKLGTGPGLWLLAFLLIPLAILFAWTFQPPGSSLGGGPEFSLAAYESVLGAESYRAVMLWTVAGAATVALMAVLLAFPIAYFVALVAGKNKYLLLGLAFIPFLTSFVLRMFAWRLILGEEGLLNKLAISLGIIDDPLSALLYNKFAVIVVLTYVWVPWAVLPMFVRLDALDRRLLEASNDLGVSPLRTVFKVVVPIALPGIYTAFFLVFIPTVGDFAAAAYVGGTKGVMIGNIVQTFLTTLNLSSGAVMTVVILAVSALLMVIGIRLAKIKSVTDVKI